jgi:hypothetical protein
MKPRRFFYHYRRCDKQMSVHFKGQCIPVRDVKCFVPCETKRQNRQPFLIMRGFAKEVTIQGDTAVIR